MKIGFDAKRLFCNFTGLGNYSRTLLRNLLHFFPDETYVLYTTEIRNNPETRPVIADEAFQIRIPDTQFKAYWRSYSIINQLVAGNVQLFHGLSHELPFKIDKAGFKSVVTIHDLIFRIHPETYSLIDRKIYDFKSAYACRHSDRIIAISKNTKNDIVKFYQIDPDKIEVIYQACNPIYYHLKHKPENDRITTHYGIPTEYLLAVGSVEPRKNLKNVIESLPWLKRDLRIPLVVVGRGGQYRREAMELARQSGLEKSVIWIENLTKNEHLQSIYQNAKALIYPSLYEGFGLPVAEALLSKTPVITSGSSSLKEAGGPSSLYINPKNPEEIAGAIEKVLSDDACRLKMIETGYQYAHQLFSPELLTKQMMECYRKLVGG